MKQYQSLETIAATSGRMGTLTGLLAGFTFTVTTALIAPRLSADVNIIPTDFAEYFVGLTGILSLLFIFATVAYADAPGDAGKELEEGIRDLEIGDKLGRLGFFGLIVTVILLIFHYGSELLGVISFAAVMTLFWYVQVREAEV